MSRLPLYRGAQPTGKYPTNESHRGLWYDRFFDGFPTDWNPEHNDESKKAWASAKKKWLETATCESAGNKSTCLEAALRLQRLCSSHGGESRVYSTTWHFATGLGNRHPLENGFLWHPTLGTPYIPGAAVKGLVRAWVENWMYAEDNYCEEKLKRLYRWFGSEDKDYRARKRLRIEQKFEPPSRGGTLDTEAGNFIFFDALPWRPVRLKADVMTPHMSKWYELGGEIQDVSTASDRLPADWHDPVPVYFLVADKPEFLFAIAPRFSINTEAEKGELMDVLDALGSALEWLGAGAKTAVGYGTMTRKPDAEERIRDEIERQELRLNQAAEVVRREQERQLVLAALGPLDREIAEYIDQRIDKNQSDFAAIIAAMKQGKWQGGKKQEIARWLEHRMRTEKGQWKPESQAKRPDKDREYQNTLLVQAWLEGK